jgi:DNA-directed RNA polymerase specialized sigma24 family protein
VNLDTLMESPTARLPSGSPLELLPARQRLVFIGRAAHIPMTELARALGISRETAYQELRAAWQAIAPRLPAALRGDIRYRGRKG